MSNNVTIKKSEISGKGVFALRDFKKGDVVLKWNPKILVKADVEKLSKKQKIYVSHIRGKYFLMQSPEKYVNHSCEANTFSKNNSDITKRNIKKGEEITADYSKEGIAESFKCKCGSKKCKKVIR